MIWFAQTFVIFATVLLTSISGYIIREVLYGRPLSWQVALTFFGLTFAGWIAIASWADFKIKRRNDEVLNFYPAVRSDG